MATFTPQKSPDQLPARAKKIEKKLALGYAFYQHYHFIV